MIDLEIGKTYKFNHSRKGKFIGRIESLDEEWCSAIVTEGQADAMLDYNIKDVGESVSMRRSFIISAIEEPPKEGE